MKVIEVYSRIYLRCLTATGEGLKRNAWTLILPVLLMMGFGAASIVVAPLGIIGGFILGFLMAALLGCYLYFLSEIVAGHPVRFSELKQSFGVYLWSVINVLFIFFIVRLVLSTLGGPNAGVLLLGLMFVSAVAFNALPETLYVRGTYGGLDSLKTSFEFLRDNLLPWAIPNVPGVLLLIFGLPILLSVVAAALGGILPPLVTRLVLSGLLGIFVHAGMIFRGHLYKELATTSHRQRMFRRGN